MLCHQALDQDMSYHILSIIRRTKRTLRIIDIRAYTPFETED